MEHYHNNLYTPFQHMKHNTYIISFTDADIKLSAFSFSNALILALAERINQGKHLGAKSVYCIETSEERHLQDRGAFPVINILWQN